MNGLYISAIRQEFLTAVKSKETVTKYSRQIIRFLQTENVKAIVIACNTASAFALDTMQKEFDLPIIGVVKPGAKNGGTDHKKR